MSGALTAMGTSTGAGGGGGGSHLDTQTLTTGAEGFPDDLDRKRGYMITAFGSLADGTSNIYAGAAIEEAYWDENGGGGLDFCQFKVNGVVANAGWTSLTGNSGRVLYRTDAIFSTAGGKSTWTWINYGGSQVSNPFSGNPILYFD